MSYRYYFKLNNWTPTKLNLVQAFKCIQKEERERICKFVHKEDFKTTLIGRLLLRKIIKQKFNLNNNEIKLIRNKHGKPILLNEYESTDDEIFDNHNQTKNHNLQFDFNISHNGDYCVGIGENVSKIGIDIMKIERRSNESLDNYFKKMRNIFTDNEWNFIRQTSNETDQLLRFFRLWTLKESFVKADGVGLSIDTKNLDFYCNTNDLKLNQLAIDSKLKFNGNLMNDWQFIEYLLDDKHCVAIAINKSNNLNDNNRFLNEIKFEQLIDNLEILDDNNDVDMNQLWDSYNNKSTKKF